MKKRNLILPALALAVGLTLGGCKNTTTDDVIIEKQNGDENKTEQTEPEIIEPEIPLEDMVCTDPQSCIDAYNWKTKIDIPSDTAWVCDFLGCDEMHTKAHVEEVGEIYKGRLRNYVKEQNIFTHNEKGIYDENGAPCINQKKNAYSHELVVGKSSPNEAMIAFMHNEHRPDKYYDVDKCINIHINNLWNHFSDLDIYKD